MRLSTEKKLLTVIVGLFSLREKAPTKNTGKSRFFKKTHEADFFEIFFNENVAEDPVHFLAKTWSAHIYSGF